MTLTVKKDGRHENEAIGIIKWFKSDLIQQGDIIDDDFCAKLDINQTVKQNL